MARFFLGRPNRRAMLLISLLVLITASAIFASLVFPKNEAIYRVETDMQVESQKIEIVESGGDIILGSKVEATERKTAALGASIVAIKNSNDRLLDEMYQSGRIDERYPVWTKLQKIEDRTEIIDKAGDIRQVRMNQNAGAIETALTKTKYNELMTPDSLDNFIPTNSIFIALLVISPVIFISTYYNNAIYKEKIDKKATLLFISPLSRWNLISAKTLPYMGFAMLAILATIMLFSFSIKTLLLSLLPVASIVIIYFSINFLLSILSRSYKEISFLKTSLGSVFIAYTLLPTLFMDMSDIAFISPLTPVVLMIDGAEFGMREYLFSFVPLMLAGAIIYYFASLLFKEEHFYARKGMLAKTLDMIAEFIKKPHHIALLTFLSFPLILVIEVVFLMLASLPTKDVNLLFILLIIVAAVVEELFKNIGIYIVFSRKLFDASVLKLGIYSGLAFAFAEKSLLLFMIPVLLDQYSKIVLVAIAIPFIFHALTCIVFGALAKKSSNPMIFIVPILIHLLYGLIVYGVFA